MRLHMSLRAFGLGLSLNDILADGYQHRPDEEDQQQEQRHVEERRQGVDEGAEDELQVVAGVANPE